MTIRLVTESKNLIPLYLFKADLIPCLIIQVSCLFPKLQFLHCEVEFLVLGSAFLNFNRQLLSLPLQIQWQLVSWNR
jgi:hypothetical protein